MYEIYGSWENISWTCILREEKQSWPHKAAHLAASKVHRLKPSAMQTASLQISHWVFDRLAEQKVCWLNVPMNHVISMTCSNHLQGFVQYSCRSPL